MDVVTTASREEELEADGQEIGIEVRHAVEGTQVHLIVLSTWTMREVRHALARQLGRSIVADSGRLVFTSCGAFVPYDDDECVGHGKPSLLFLGASLAGPESRPSCLQQELAGDHVRLSLEEPNQRVTTGGVDAPSSKVSCPPGLDSVERLLLPFCLLAVSTLLHGLAASCQEAAVLAQALWPPREPATSASERDDQPNSKEEDSPGRHHSQADQAVTATTRQGQQTCAQPIRQSSLRCHMLFASPLCLERGVRVQLDFQISPSDCTKELLTGQLVKKEVESWGVDFDEGASFMRSINASGRVHRWNMEQQEMQSVIQEGDELVFIELAGRRAMLRGRHPALVLQNLLVEVAACWTAAGAWPKSLALGFRALRPMQPLQVHEEIQAITASGCDVASQPATMGNLVALLSGSDCQILHLALHCSNDPQLAILEDGEGKAHLVALSDFQILLAQVQGQRHLSIMLTFLSACHSQKLGEYFIAAGVRHVICIKDGAEVRNRSCQSFAYHFFHALCIGHTVKDAFKCGVAALAFCSSKESRADAAAFMLLPLQDQIHHVALLTSCTQTPTTMPWQFTSTRSPELVWGKLPPQVEDFLGREVAMHRVLRLILRRRFVELLGEHGFGKSVLLTEIGRYVALRAELFEEVRWIDAAVDSRENITQGLALLCQRLASTPKRKVLLLINDASTLCWVPLDRLLSFPYVHTVLSTVQQDSKRVAMALGLGLKPVFFELGPLQPEWQAKLYLRRAARPFYTHEILGHAQPLKPTIASPAMALHPSQLLALAARPELQALAGSPGKIVAAASTLSRHGKAASTDMHAERSGSRLRRAHIRHFDGRCVDEWLALSQEVAELQMSRAPAPEAHLGVDVYVDGFLAPPHAQLSQMASQDSELLHIEFKLQHRNSRRCSHLGPADM